MTLSRAVAGMALAMACALAPAQAQSISGDVAKMLAPTGTLRVGVLMVWYFALEDKASGKLEGVIPDLGRELARRAGVAAELSKLENPAR
jgi:polar amino acid transport system substrate-binding protein